MKYIYNTRADIILTESNISHTVFGIEVFDSSGTLIQSISDVFFTLQEAISFAKLCNLKKLSPTHLMDVIDDILST